MVLDPGGATVLVSNFTGGTITRTTICGVPPCATTVLKDIARPEGLAYDAGGRLFVLAGGFGGVAQLFQINPVTGATVNTSAAFDPTNTLDGLVFDPFSGRLFATSQGGNAVYSIDPNTLVAVKVASSVGTPGFGPDGVITDTHGTLYIAVRDFHVWSLNVTTNALSGPLAPLVFGLDDLGAVALTPPVITKTFALPQVVIGTDTTMTITIVNSNTAAVTGINFVDTLPVGLAVGPLGVIANTCTPPGTVTAVAGGTSVSLAGATLPAAVPPATTSCSITVDVRGITVAQNQNCVTVMTGNAGTGNQSCAQLTVVAAPPVLVPPSIVKTFGRRS